MAAISVENQPSGTMLPIEFKNRIMNMDGSNPVFLIKKSLKENDVSHESNRLSLPLREINGIFLTLEELRLLSSSGGGEEMKVLLLEPSFQECQLSLKRRDSGSYELTRDWSSVVARNDLQLGTTVQLWGFRVKSKLCLALIV